METNIVEIRKVSAGYEKKKKRPAGAENYIVKEITMDIPEGHCVSLLGPNGSGKTTLLRVIAGMLEADGEILIDGKSISSLKRKEIAKYISFFSQMTRVYFSYSVYETVMQGRYVHGSSFFSNTASLDKEVVEETLEALGLQDLSDKQITVLSGGQLQRVMLARCIAQESPVLILDEPMNHLDMKIQSEFLDYLMKWREKPVRMPGMREYAPTIIGVFHDINTAAYIADEIALLSEGRLLSFGPKEEVLKKELLEEAYRFDVTGFLRKYRVAMDTSERDRR